MGAHHCISFVARIGKDATCAFQYHKLDPLQEVL